MSTIKEKAAGLRTRAAPDAYSSGYSTSLDLVLTRLRRVRKSGAGWHALCPAHDDKHPSLSIKEGEGKVLLFCHAGCTFDRRRSGP
jgi:hypothetical protein